MQQSKVFVGNLAFRLEPDRLRELFEEVGKVDDVFFPTDRNTGRPRGFAFVTFESQEAANEAIERFDGFEFEGRPLKVNEARPRTEGSERPAFRSGPREGGFRDGGRREGGFREGGGGGGFRRGGEGGGASGGDGFRRRFDGGSGRSEGGPRGDRPQRREFRPRSRDDY